MKVNSKAQGEGSFETVGKGHHVGQLWDSYGTVMGQLFDGYLTV